MVGRWIAFGLQPAALGEFLTVPANSPEKLSEVRYSNVQEFKCLDDQKSARLDFGHNPELLLAD